MTTLLLVIIYIAFISLGLPDSILGAAWPIMHVEFNVPSSYAGIVSMSIAFCTIVSSLLSERITKKMGTGLLVAISVLLTAGGLIGFSFSTKFYMLLIFAIPYGLGAGSIDAALNNYVALHFSSKHMNWLHCFWGLGASLGPYILGAYLLRNATDWNSGYRLIFIIQIIITIIMFISIPLWKRKEKEDNLEKTKAKNLKEIFKIKNVMYVMIAFMLYCGLESTSILWGSTYLVQAKGINEATAATYGGLFITGLGVGRLLSGFVSNKLGDKTMIRIGQSFMALAIVLLFFKENIFSLIALVMMGFGCAPIYPSIIHVTPINFGKENSQALVGVQMAFAYIGSTFIPPLFGLLSSLPQGINFYPYFSLIFFLGLIIMTEVLNYKLKPKKHLY